jgi:DNA-binding transcriptional regulator PaaX
MKLEERQRKKTEKLTQQLQQQQQQQQQQPVSDKEQEQVWSISWRFVIATLSLTAHRLLRCTCSSWQV